MWQPYDKICPHTDDFLHALINQNFLSQFYSLYQSLITIPQFMHTFHVNKELRIQKNKHQSKFRYPSLNIIVN